MLKHMLLTKRPTPRARAPGIKPGTDGRHHDTWHDVTPAGAEDRVPPQSPLWCVALDELVRIELFSPTMATATGSGDDRPPSVDIQPEYSGLHRSRQAWLQRRRSGVLVQSRRASRASSSDCTRRTSLRRRSSTDLRLGSSAGTTVSGLAHRVHSRSSLDFLNERRGPLRRESGRAQDTFDSPVDVLLEAEADVDVFPVGTKPGEQIDVGLRRQRHSDGLIKHADANDRRPLRLVSRSGSMDGDTNGSGTAGSESSSHGAKRHSRLIMRRSRRAMMDGKLAACLATFSEANNASLQSSCHNRARKFSAERQQQQQRLRELHYATNA